MPGGAQSMSHSEDLSKELEFLTANLIDHFVQVQTKSELIVGKLEAASFDKEYGIVLTVQLHGGHQMVKVYFKDIAYMAAKNFSLNLDTATMLRRIRDKNILLRVQHSGVLSSNVVSGTGGTTTATTSETAPPANSMNSMFINSQQALLTYPNFMNYQQPIMTIPQAPLSGIGLQGMPPNPQIQQNVQQINPQAMQPFVQMQYNQQMQPFALMQSYHSQHIQPMAAGHNVSGQYNQAQIGHASVNPYVPPLNPAQIGHASVNPYVPPLNPAHFPWGQPSSGYGYTVPAVRQWHPGQAQAEHFVPRGHVQHFESWHPRPPQR